MFSWLALSVAFLPLFSQAGPAWSTYRPNLYFGLRPNVSDTLQTGMLWTGVQPGQGSQSIARLRHSCEQDDGVDAYNWIRHDGRNAGTQEIRDTENNVLLRVHFLKIPGGDHGQRTGIVCTASVSC